MKNLTKKQIFTLFLSLASLLILNACSGAKSRATCFDCTTQPQKWSAFSFEKLEGTWRGTQEKSVNELDAKDIVNTTKKVELTFLGGDKFLRAYNVEASACEGFPTENSIVLLKQLWWDKAKKAPANILAFDVFHKIGRDKVGFGRVYIEQNKKKNAYACEYVANTKEIPMNRLSLPVVAYSRRMSADGRMLASGQQTKEVDVQMEFLNFEHAKIKSEYRWQGKNEKDAPLFFRFIKTERNISDAFDSGEWQNTEESIFKLWPVVDIAKATNSPRGFK